MNAKLSNDDIERLILEGDARARPGKAERLRVLADSQVTRETPFSGLAYEYFEEARLCWYDGAFVACIVMAQMAFEETLRTYYRASRGIGGCLDNRRKVDDVGLGDLVNQANLDGFLTSEEVEKLNQIRREIRNPYVHPKEGGNEGQQDPNSSHKDFFTLHLKIVAPNLVGSSIVDEARESVLLLTKLLPLLGFRLLPS